jgi:hypothetical protein
MARSSPIGAIALTAALLTTVHVQATDELKYPDWNGQWVRAHPRSQWDPSKPRGLQQQAPLTPEYQVIFEAHLKALRASTEGVDPQLRCLPSGMPRVMIAYEPIEIIVTPQTTYVRTDHMSEFRRIYTDGRGWPAAIKPSYEGYSIGKWTDENGVGRYDALEVETRGPFKGPRYFDADGLPMHKNNRTIVKERISLDKANRDLLHNEITTIDDALTRPWTVTRSYKRERKPLWPEYLCAEANQHVIVGKERYFRSADGHLMPTRKDQPPPDLRYFNQSR